MTTTDEMVIGDEVPICNLELTFYINGTNEKDITGFDS
jgi:hypothetical protein